MDEKIREIIMFVLKGGDTDTIDTPYVDIFDNGNVVVDGIIEKKTIDQGVERVKQLFKNGV